MLIIVMYEFQMLSLGNQFKVLHKHTQNIDIYSNKEDRRPETCYVESNILEAFRKHHIMCL